MHYEVVFATDNDEEELAELFGGYGMALAGDVCEHILIKIKDELIAAAFVTSTDNNNNFFHLAVFATNRDRQKQGMGSQLLQKILKQPQKYCYNQVDRSSPIKGTFQVTTVAKGSSAGFYEKNGFAACGFDELAFPYNVQCEQCPDKQECDPVPMVFWGDN